MVNDTIYELAKQVGLIEFESIPGSAAVTPNYESVVKARKFAELIVRECVEVANNHFESKEPGYPGDKIEQHFGVEE